MRPLEAGRTVWAGPDGSSHDHGAQTALQGYVQMVLRTLMRHRVVAAAIVVLAAVPLLWFPETRWATLATLWGFAAVTIAVSYLVEQRVRSSWARSGGRGMSPLLETTSIQVRAILSRCPVPRDLVRRMADDDYQQRMDAVEAARGFIDDTEGELAGPYWEKLVWRDGLVLAIQNSAAELSAVRAGNASVLRTLPDLQDSMVRLAEAVHFASYFLTSHRLPIEARARALIALSRASLDVCHYCYEAGAAAGQRAA
ncbi:MAG TPA: hypothetical protein VIA06_11265 [Candidatus Dormibacteraeota bacterium]|nr:hypothetical protein [Candidatus Dormibacteraeota bacterium]